MKTEQFISAEEFCILHHLDISFIGSISQSGLIEITQIEENRFIAISQLPKLEKIIRLHDLDINLAGIEAIIHLLERMENMQQQIIRIQNRLNSYED